MPRPKKAPKPVKISYAGLIEKIQQKTLTSEEFGAYFVDSPVEASLFRPAMRLNPGTVDLSGIEKFAQASATELAIEASAAARSTRLAALVAAPMPNGTIIAEGDSWFNLPVFIYPRTLVDVLQERFPINNIAMWGDEFYDIIADGEYIAYLNTGSVKYLLFSAGGNDILGGGRLYDFLNLYDPDHSRPADAAYYLKPEFFAALDGLEEAYRHLADTVLRISPATRILVHGYDNCIPRPNGRHLGGPMTRQGLDPVHMAPLCQAIIALMVKCWNDRLSMIDRDYANFTHVKVVGTVTRNGWHDELHPNGNAAARVADKFAPLLT